MSKVLRLTVKGGGGQGGVSLETGGLDGTTACSPVSYVPSPFTQAPRAITLLVTLLVTLDTPRGGA